MGGVSDTTEVQAGKVETKKNGGETMTATKAIAKAIAEGEVEQGEILLLLVVAVSLRLLLLLLATVDCCWFWCCGSDGDDESGSNERRNRHCVSLLSLLILYVDRAWLGI